MGRVTGRATGFLHRARTRFSDFARETELSTVQGEVQDTLAQLAAIREELRSGVSLVHPGCVCTCGHGWEGGWMGRLMVWEGLHRCAKEAPESMHALPAS